VTVGGAVIVFVIIDIEIYDIEINEKKMLKK